MALPNFIGVGAQKAGTTPLFYLLRQHPDIYLHLEKETHFFSKTRHHENMHFYEWTMFASYAGQRAIGEISPEYMRTPGVARAIRAVLGRIKIIICLREPLARAFSHYHHCLRAAEDNRSFFEACRADALLPLTSEVHAEIACAYVRGSLYPYQIEEWQREFGAENLFFCILERDFASEQAKSELLERLFQFLDVTATGVEIDPDIRNISAPAPKLRFPQSPGTVKFPKSAVPFEGGDILVESGHFMRIVRRPSPALRAFFEGMAQDMTAQLAPAESEMLRRTYFADVTERTSELIGEDLTAIWRPRDAEKSGDAAQKRTGDLSAMPRQASGAEP